MGGDGNLQVGDILRGMTGFILVTLAGFLVVIQWIKWAVRPKK